MARVTIEDCLKRIDNAYDICSLAMLTTPPPVANEVAPEESSEQSSENTEDKPL